MSRFSDYLESISQVNGLGNGMENGQKIHWLFHCGMLFSSKDKWWGDFKFRHSAHEGIDITYYRTHLDGMHRFDDSIKVPAMDDGIILNICDDFLGQTLVIEHENPLLFNRRILFAYAHIIPEKNLKTDRIVKKGEIIARVCDTCKNPQLPPHLHFSCFEVLKQVPPEHLDWNLFFSENLEVNLVHPIFL
ncbi:peptidoglycan DD-metalloendopeptidase family protein [Desulfobacula sp.]|uniref:peptidoglycan DD-metalloendopeptidase family protein n=1 Tax=Desulfobacula sp. TaxID=2593537 RepID=UPI00262CF8D4|nr:peptidoglycan DD-metalloendopeptidase family protein [Desulfobacula sp.]